VEDAGLAVYESAARNETKEAVKPRSSIRDKLSAAKKEQPSRTDAPKKAKKGVWNYDVHRGRNQFHEHFNTSSRGR
jgi:hypothetical protein